MKKRCAWCGDDERYRLYHDEEWGVPSHDEQHLFEMLTLEGAQAGLSWSTILNKRENYRLAFAEFDPVKVARFRAARVEKLLLDPGIVRNRLKVESTVANAKAFLAVQKEHGGFAEFLWSFVDHRPKQNRWKNLKEIPAETPESKELSKALRKRGFRFVGPTICYALMQAVGMVNDHETGCFRYREVKKLV